MSRHSRKWSPARRKAFAERQAAKKNPPIQGIAEEVNFVATPSPFAEFVNSLERFHRELRRRLESVASLFD